jgi:ribose/xylose/arabinose/galactoside ABC-type transport system permease subunit
MTDMTTLDYKTPTPSIEPTRRVDWGDLVGKLGPLIGFVFVFLLFTILVQVVPGARPFATLDNADLVLRLTAVVGISAVGMTLVIISGGIDLSVGSVMALTTVVTAQMLVRGEPVVVAAAAGILAGAACGLLIGSLVAGVKLSPFIVTLGLWGAVRGAAKGLASNQTIYPPEAWHATRLYGLLQPLPDNRRWMLVPGGVWIMLFLVVLVAAVLRYTRFGRHVFAIGSNEQTARLCGVPVGRTKLLIYLLGSAFAGLAGIVEFSRLTTGDPTTRTGAELDVIAAVVIGGASLSGGQGSVLGSLIGALIMTMVANGCNKLGLPNWVQEIATGAIIIFAVALDRLRHRRGA